MKLRILLVALFLCWCGSTSFAQANGKLQIDFMDVGQGDGAVLISPLGEVVLFDNGVNNQCQKPVSYLAQLGVTKIDYLFVSHYHADHIGCTAQVLNRFPLQKQSLDRSGSYNSAAFNDETAKTLSLSASPLVVSIANAEQGTPEPAARSDEQVEDSKKWTPLWYLLRVVAVLAGGFCVYLGYKLFVLGVSGQASLMIESKTMKGQLINASPGIFFALFGMALIAVVIWKTP